MTPATETALLKVLASIDLSLKELVQAVRERPAGGGGSGAAPTPAGPVVPFGKNKGKSLGELADRSLAFYAFDWEPRTGEGFSSPSPRDRAFKAAALAEARKRGLNAEGEPEETGAAEDSPPPFTPPPRREGGDGRPAFDPNEDDSDVPF